MKKILGPALFAVLILCGSTGYAQQVKLGYVNSSLLISVMPERDSAQTKYQAFALELQDQLEGLETEMGTKLQKYQNEVNTYGEAIRAQKEKELNELSNRVNEFRQAAQQDLDEMEQTLMRPVIEKANEAIQKVAKDNGFTAIFDLAAGALLYYDTATMTDILPLVKTALNITK
ncbi:MAG: OmpH family outer membrane protein [Rikenellaceae bacterium]|jgi:outer membrane protein|nr:OmpH family outer membrane protein [Rikenellaceae bacterium]